MDEIGNPYDEDPKQRSQTMIHECADNMEDDLVQFWRGNGLVG